MTYKAAINRIPHGGGKSVLMRPKGEFDRTALFLIAPTIGEITGAQCPAAAG